MIGSNEKEERARRPISAPHQDPCGSPEEHNGGRTCFCGRLIILDTHVHSEIHSPQTVMLNMYILQHKHCKDHRRMCICVHAKHTYIHTYTHTNTHNRSTPYLSCFTHFPQIQLYSPEVIFCYIHSKGAMQQFFGNGNSHFSVCVCMYVHACASLPQQVLPRSIGPFKSCFCS